jgi:hypothetical protein
MDNLLEVTLYKTKQELFETKFKSKMFLLFDELNKHILGERIKEGIKRAKIRR